MGLALSRPIITERKFDGRDILQIFKPFVNMRRNEILPVFAKLSFSQLGSVFGYRE